MIHLLFILYLSQIVQGISIHIPTPSCPPPDATSRSIWSILGSCALTLLTCVWHAFHPDLPFRVYYGQWYGIWAERLSDIAISVAAPEAMVYLAIQQWRRACGEVEQFQSMLSPVVVMQYVSDKCQNQNSQKEGMNGL